MNSDEFDLAARRARLEREGFLSLTEPRDALAAYYALYHDHRRTQLWLHFDRRDRIDGLMAVCQTGFDLFQPTVVLRAHDEEAAVDPPPGMRSLWPAPRFRLTRPGGPARFRTDVQL